MEHPYFYERFVRHAFHVERSQDPAGLADTSYFYQENIALIKAAVTYAMAIYQNQNTIMEDSDYRSFINNVLEAEKIEEISDLIEQFNVFVGKVLK